MGTLHLPNKKTDIVEEVHRRQEKDNRVDEHEREQFEKIKEKEEERVGDKPAAPSQE